MVKRLIDDGIERKLRIEKDGMELSGTQKNYDYSLNKVGVYETFPLIYGSGTYTIGVWSVIPGKGKISRGYSPKIEVQLDNEQTPFLYPNQVVDYDAASKAVDYSFTLCKEDNNDLKRVKSIYDYIVNNIKYDDDKAEEIIEKNLYMLPEIDKTLEVKKGICFDYAGLMAAMCRAQHIPCKVITGDTTIEYHAWVEVWLEGKGWINPEVLFESDAWTRMDPTFEASGAKYDDYYETRYVY